MFWPLILPTQITFVLLTALVVLATALAPKVKWKRTKALGNSLALAILVFVPSCSGIMSLVDAQRFGIFQYAEYVEVKDLRIERYLPPRARDITLKKRSNGHLAKYSITESELMAYLDDCWVRAAGRSAVPRDQLNNGTPLAADAFPPAFIELNWPVLHDTVRFHSPVQSDGGGAAYFFEPTTNTAYHQAAYW